MLTHAEEGAARRRLAGAYARQRAELDARHVEAGIDVFVSPFDILTDKVGVEFSYSTWPEGVATWLRTECVALTGKRSGHSWFLIVRWEVLEATCPGALAPIADSSPVRLRTITWPSAAELATLETLAIIKSH